MRNSTGKDFSRQLFVGRPNTGDAFAFRRRVDSLLESNWLTNDGPLVRELEERLAVKCLLRPFSEQETTDYVAHRLDVAGARQTLFETEAMSALYRLTHGVARQINRLLDLALLIGYADQRRAISAAHLEAVSQELVTVVPE